MLYVGELAFPCLLQVMTVSEVFAKQLMQLSGVSPDKAAAILDKYPTPRR